jgi:hypothetical protein
MVWTLAQAGIGPVPQGWKLSGSASVFRSDPLNGRRSNAKLLSNLQDPGPILSPEGLADIIFCFLIDLGPAELLSFLLGSCKPCPYTLLDHGSFEFGEPPPSSGTSPFQRAWWCRDLVGEGTDRF